jgi:hypothetical protein
MSWAPCNRGFKYDANGIPLAATGFTAFRWFLCSFVPVDDPEHWAWAFKLISEQHDQVGG